LALDGPSRETGLDGLISICDSVVTRPRLALKSWLHDGNLQLSSPFLPFFLGKLTLALLEGNQFFLRRLKKAVAWCYCQLSVSRH